jgi:hypothetical protein
MTDGPAARPVRPTWFPEPARPTLDHEGPLTDDDRDAYLNDLDLYESKD